MTTRLPSLDRDAVQRLVLTVVAYVPLLLNDVGRVAADTKAYLYLDPGRLLARAPYMWQPEVAMGTVTHQNIGYLWPVGPFFWFGEALGLPDWITQRLWLGSVLLAAGLVCACSFGPSVGGASPCWSPRLPTCSAHISSTTWTATR